MPTELFFNELKARLLILDTDYTVEFKRLIYFNTYQVNEHFVKLSHFILMA